MIEPDFALIVEVQLFVALLLTWLGAHAQLITYPRFWKIAESEFPRHHAAHTFLMGWQAGPLLLLEAGLALYWYTSAAGWAASVNLLLIGLVWLVTAIWILPIHDRYRREGKVSSRNRLLGCNLIRVLLWAGRVILLLVVLVSQ